MKIQQAMNNLDDIFPSMIYIILADEGKDKISYSGSLIQISLFTCKVEVSGMRKFLVSSTF